MLETNFNNVEQAMSYVDYYDEAEYKPTLLKKMSSVEESGIEVFLIKPSA